MSIRFRYSATLAAFPCRDGWEFPFAAGEDVAVSALQALVLTRHESFVFASGEPRAGLFQQALHVRRPPVAVGLHDRGELAQQVHPTQAMATMLIGKVGRPAVVDDHPSVARDHPDRRHRIEPAFPVHELQGDLPSGADGDRLVVLVHAERSLIEGDRPEGEKPPDRLLLPPLERQVQLKYALEDRSLGDRQSNQGLDRVLHALEGNHLGDQKVQRLRLDARSILLGTGEALGGRRAGVGATVRAGFDLGVDVAENFLKDHVDLGAPFVTAWSDLAQILPTFLAGADLGDRNGLDGAGVPRAARVKCLALGMATGMAERAVVLLGSRGWLAGVRAGLGNFLLNEHSHPHLHHHQQRLDHGTALGADLALAGQLPEVLLEGGELLAQRLPVEARHESRRGRLLADLHHHHPRKHHLALGRWHRRLASSTALGSALDRLALGVVAPRIACPLHPIRAEVEPELRGVPARLVHHLQLEAAPAMVSSFVGHVLAPPRF